MQETRDNIPGGEAPGFDQSIITVAEILRTGREKRGQDLRSVADVLRIRYVFLEAIERGDFASLPGDTYAYGFVRTYAGYLNLDKDEIVRQFKQEVENYGSRKTLVFPTPVPESKTPGFGIILISIVLLAVAYGGWSAISRFDVEIPDWVPFLSEGDSVGGSDDVVGSSSDDPSGINMDGINTAEVASQQDNPNNNDEAVDVLPPSVNEQSETQSVPEQAAVVVEEAVDNLVSPESESQSESPALPVVQSEPISPSVPGVPETVEPETVVDNAPDNSLETSSDVANVTSELSELSDEDSTTSSDTVASTVVTPPLPPEPEVFGDEGVASAISIFAERDTWMHIVDGSGEAIFSRVLRAGSVYNVPLREGLVMATGNAGGITLKLNGQDLPKIGPLGAVRRDILLSEDGLLESIQAE